MTEMPLEVYKGMMGMKGLHQARERRPNHLDSEAVHGRPEWFYGMEAVWPYSPFNGLTDLL